MIRAYATAKCLVGPHGASLTNMIFAPEGTRVLEVQTHKGWHLYQRIAEKLGMVYAKVKGDFLQVGPWLAHACTRARAHECAAPPLLCDAAAAV